MLPNSSCQHGRGQLSQKSVVILLRQLRVLVPKKPQPPMHDDCNHVERIPRGTRGRHGGHYQAHGKRRHEWHSPLPKSLQTSVRPNEMLTLKAMHNCLSNLETVTHCSESCSRWSFRVYGHEPLPFYLLYIYCRCCCQKHSSNPMRE